MIITIKNKHQRGFAKSSISKEAKGYHIEIYKVTTLYFLYIPIYKKYSVIKSQL